MHFYPFENSSAYSFIEAGRYALAPLRSFIIQQHTLLNMTPATSTTPGRYLLASYELWERLTRKYPKPEFGIAETIVDGKRVKVTQKVILKKNFCNLLHFKKSSAKKQPKILIVAPLSGHYATLLRGTVADLLPESDVYITDWINAREVPVDKGDFDLDDFIDYIIEFVKKLDGDVHVMAVCQPVVPVMAAISIMHSERMQFVPKSMLLLGGPIDARKSPTKVNDFALERPMEWFQQNMITTVPFNYKGFGRHVYPGYIQLMGFMAMNMKRHVGEHVKLFKHLVIGDGENAQKHKDFYNEYLSVMDMPAEFYLQTIKVVFKDYALPLGKMVSRERPVKPELITKTALFGIEGELDDISGVGQTKAALNLCKNLAKSKKSYLLQKGVGHYGIFNGSKFRKFVAPKIIEFVKKHNNTKFGK